MSDLTHDEFLVLAKQAGIDSSQSHLDVLLSDVQTIIDRIVLMGEVDVEAREPQFAGQHPSGPQVVNPPTAPAAVVSRRREIPSDICLLYTSPSPRDRG